MKLNDYLLMISKLKTESKNSDFLYAIIDSFIRDSYANETIINPLDKFYNSEETLRGIYNGSKSLSRKCASEIYNLYDKTKMMNFFYQRTDNFDDFKDALLSKGFEIDINEENDEDIPSTLADLLAKIIENISKGQKETKPPLRKINIHNLERDAFKNVYITDRYLHINGQIIELPHHFSHENIEIDSRLPYIIELLKVYSKLCDTPIQTIVELKKYPSYEKHFNEQRKYYFSAEAIKRSVRDLFTDGEEHFNILKNEIFDAIYETYIDLTLDDGYQRLKNVLEMITKANLNGSLLLNIKGLINIKERKGICHMLVNDGRIKSWVKVDYEQYF